MARAAAVAVAINARAFEMSSQFARQPGVDIKHYAESADACSPDIAGIGLRPSREQRRKQIELPARQ
jgi:hypothetical protein